MTAQIRVSLCEIKGRRSCFWIVVPSRNFSTIRPSDWHNFRSEFFPWMEHRALPNAYRSPSHLLRIVALSRQPDLHGECTYGRLSTVWKAEGAKGHLRRLSPCHILVLFREKRGAWESFDRARASSIECPIETVSSRGRIRYYYILAIDFIGTAESTWSEHSAPKINTPHWIRK